MSSSNPIGETTLQHSAVASSSLAGHRAQIPEASAFTGMSLAPTAATAWAAAICRVTNYLMNDCGSGRRVLKLAWVINFQKLATIPRLAFFIAHDHNTGSLLRRPKKACNQLCC